MRVRSSILISVVAAALAFGLGAASAPVYPFNRAYEWLARQVRPFDPAASPIYRQKTQIFASDHPAPIVMLGDSLTEYGDWERLLDRTDVANQGIPGDVSAGVLERVRALKSQGGTVFVLIGINDPSHYIPAEETKRNIAGIVEELASRSSTVYLQSLILTRSPKLNRYVEDINVFERQLCASGQCTYVDLNAALGRDGMLDPAVAIDDVHINAAGYVRWGKVVRGYLPQS